MFGKNPIRSQELTRTGTFWVQEIFRTIQGEGPLSGTPAIFIRLAGCNLACTFCDTDFESSGWRPTLDEIVSAVTAAGGDRRRTIIVISGGEPFRQDLDLLVERFLFLGFRIQIETAGTLWVGMPHNQALSIVVSPKTGKVREELITHPSLSAWKYIIDAEVPIHAPDGLPAGGTQTQDSKVILARPPAWFPRDEIFLQPCDRYDEGKNKANVELAKQLCLQHGYRLSLQLHKILNLP